MKILSKYYFFIILFSAVIIIYFALRLPNLTLQPIFADEAIYIRWAQVMKSEPTLRFLPLSDGKTPLFMWVMMPMFKVFDDPLYAGRLLSVLSGFVTLLGVFTLGWRVFGVRTAILGAYLYAIVPYTVFFDRMALVDSMLAAFTVWGLILSLWLLKNPRLDLAMLLGYLLGGALLVKTPAMMNLFVLPFTLLGFDFKNAKRYDLLRLFFAWTVVIVIAFIMYNALRLGPGFYQLSARNTDYVFSLAELYGRPFDPFIPHLHDIREWYEKLLGLPFAVALVSGLFFILRDKVRLGIVILLWALIPGLVLTAFLKTFTARYLLFTIPPLLVLAAYGIDSVINRFEKWRILMIPTIVLSFSLSVLPTDYLLLTKPEQASLPKNERRGYFEDWTAGYGLKEVAAFLKQKKLEHGTIIVGTEGFFGTLPDGLYIYLDKEGIPIIGHHATISAQLRESALTYPTFMVANRNRMSVFEPNTKLIQEFPKAKPLKDYPQDAIILLEILPE